MSAAACAAKKYACCNRQQAAALRLANNLQQILVVQGVRDGQGPLDEAGIAEHEEKLRRIFGRIDEASALLEDANAILERDIVKPYIRSQLSD